MTPELLSPAGTLAAMRQAFAYGADAVYAGQPRYSLRVRNNEFDLATLATAITEAHTLGKKLYVVSNIAPHNRKLETLIKDMAPVVALGPDAFIVSDPGVVLLMREHFPHMPLHLSVQANTINWAAVKFWQQQGVSRVILSRELGIEEIAEIREKVPDMEIEVFVHGALCMAYSGRCLLSGYFNKRDPNQGACTNACRWQYRARAAEVDEVGQINPVVLEEPMRPGEYMPLDEDEHGSYIMNSKDLRAVQHVAALSRIGVHSLKIEGRTKTPYYVARTAQVYRQAIDDAVAEKPFNPGLIGALDGMANRGFTEGFLQRHRPQDTQNYVTSHSSGLQQLVGALTGKVIDGKVEIEVKNKFRVGDKLELMTPGCNISWPLGGLFNHQGQPIEIAKGSGHKVWVALPKTNLDEDNLLTELDNEQLSELLRHAYLLRTDTSVETLAVEVS